MTGSRCSASTICSRIWAGGCGARAGGMRPSSSTSMTRFQISRFLTSGRWPTSVDRSRPAVWVSDPWQASQYSATSGAMACGADSPDSCASDSDAPSEATKAAATVTSGRTRRCCRLIGAVARVLTTTYTTRHHSYTARCSWVQAAAAGPDPDASAASRCAAAEEPGHETFYLLAVRRCEFHELDADSASTSATAHHGGAADEGEARGQSEPDMECRSDGVVRADFQKRTSRAQRRHARRDGPLGGSGGVDLRRHGPLQTYPDAR